MSEGHWDHRIVRSFDAGQEILAIHEVHYDAAGRPVDHTGPTIVDGETVTELDNMLASMRAALERPILSGGDFVVTRAMSVPAGCEQLARPGLISSSRKTRAMGVLR